MRTKILLGALAAAATMISVPAQADYIDGNWCYRDGRTFSINGPTIVTPGRSRLAGRYTRHSFTYVVPDTEPNAGTKVAMTQLNQMTIHVTEETTPGSGETSPIQVWKRCTPTVS